MNYQSFNTILLPHHIKNLNHIYKDYNQIWHMPEEKLYELEDNIIIQAQDILYYADNQKTLSHTIFKTPQHIHFIALLDSVVGYITCTFSVDKMEDFLSLYTTEHSGIKEEIAYFKVSDFLCFLEKNILENKLNTICEEKVIKI